MEAEKCNLANARCPHNFHMQMHILCVHVEEVCWRADTQLRMCRYIPSRCTESLGSSACALSTGRSVPVKATGQHQGTSSSSYLASSGVYIPCGGGGGGGGGGGLLKHQA